MLIEINLGTCSRHMNICSFSITLTATDTSKKIEELSLLLTFQFLDNKEVFKGLFSDVIETRL